MTQRQCAASEEAIWIVQDGRGDCIRYFSFGLKDENPTVLIFFPGDVALPGELTAQNGGSQAIYPDGDNKPELLRARMRRISQRFGLPAIFVARPGVYGSSGNHDRERRGRREVHLMSGALDELKKRHNIGNFALAGHSGGGHIVGAMLAERTDINCAAMASGILAARAHAVARGWRANDPAIRDVYDPIDHVDEISKNSDVKIFMIGDEKDSVVPFRTQKMYFDKLIKRGLNARLVRGQASDPQHHGLEGCGIRIAALCAQNRDPLENSPIFNGSSSYCNF
jgi:hypothetical protein